MNETNVFKKYKAYQTVDQSLVWFSMHIQLLTILYIIFKICIYLYLSPKSKAHVSVNGRCLYLCGVCVCARVCCLSLK